MKKKITYFILIIAFFISAVRCSVDAKIPLPEDCSIFTPLDLPPFIPEVQEFHIYTEEEQSQVRQNLIGRYQNTINNQEIILEIRADGLYFNSQSQGTIELVYPYSVVFSVSSEPILMINNVYIYYIECNPNNPTQVLGFNDGLNPEIYYRRLDNNENNNPHEEL